MEIQKIFSSYDDYGYEDSRIYSVLLSEDEMALFSEVQKEFGRAAQRRKKQKAQRYANARTPNGMTAAQVVSPEAGGRGNINVASARRAAIEGAVPTEQIQAGAPRPVISAQAAEGITYPKGSVQQKAQAERTVQIKENHKAPIAKRRGGVMGDTRVVRELENNAAREANLRRYNTALGDKMKNLKGQVSDLTSQLGSVNNRLSETTQNLLKEQEFHQATKKAAEEASKAAAKKLRRTRVGAGIAIGSSALAAGTGAYMYGKNRASRKH